MGKSTFLLYTIGLTLSWIALELSVDFNNIQYAVSAIVPTVTIPVTLIHLIALASMIYVNLAFYRRLKRYTNPSCFYRTIVCYLVMFGIMISMLKVDGGHWGLALMISSVSASIGASPYRLSGLGSLESTMRMIPLNVINLFIILGLQMGVGWNISILFVVDDILLYMFVAHLFTYLPLARLVLNVAMFSSAKCLIPTVIKIGFCVALVDLVPYSGSVVLIHIAMCIYTVILISIFLNYSYRLDVLKGKSCEERDKILLNGTGLSSPVRRIIVAYLPD